MMNINMKKVMTYIGAIGAAVTCLVMVTYEVLYMHVPAPARFAWALFMLTYVIAEYGMKKTKQGHFRTACKNEKIIHFLAAIFESRSYKEV